MRFKMMRKCDAPYGWECHGRNRGRQHTGMRGLGGLAWVVGELEGGSQDAMSCSSSPAGQAEGGADGMCEEADTGGG